MARRAPAAAAWSWIATVVFLGSWAGSLAQCTFDVSGVAVPAPDTASDDARNSRLPRVISFTLDASPARRDVDPLPFSLDIFAAGSEQRMSSGSMSIQAAQTSPAPSVATYEGAFPLYTIRFGFTRDWYNETLWGGAFRLQVQLRAGSSATGALAACTARSLLYVYEATRLADVTAGLPPAASFVCEACPPGYSIAPEVAVLSPGEAPATASAFRVSWPAGGPASAALGAQTVGARFSGLPEGPRVRAFAIFSVLVADSAWQAGVQRGIYLSLQLPNHTYVPRGGPLVPALGGGAAGPAAPRDFFYDTSDAAAALCAALRAAGGDAELGEGIRASAASCSVADPDRPAAFPPELAMVDAGAATVVAAAIPAFCGFVGLIALTACARACCCAQPLQHARAGGLVAVKRDPDGRRRAEQRPGSSGGPPGRALGQRAASSGAGQRAASSGVGARRDSVLKAGTEGVARALGIVGPEQAQGKRGLTVTAEQAAALRAQEREAERERRREKEAERERKREERQRRKQKLSGAGAGADGSVGGSFRAGSDLAPAAAASGMRRQRRRRAGSRGGRCERRRGSSSERGQGGIERGHGGSGSGGGCGKRRRSGSGGGASVLDDVFEAAAKKAAAEKQDLSASAALGIVW
eukprot:tig00000093_g3565.t1